MLSLKTSTVTSEGESRKSCEQRGKHQWVYLDSGNWASIFRIYGVRGWFQVPVGPHLELVLLLCRDRERRQSFALKAHLCSQPLPLTPAPNIRTFSYYSPGIWPIARQSTGAAEKRQALLLSGWTHIPAAESSASLCPPPASPGAWVSIQSTFGPCAPGPA